MAERVRRGRCLPRLAPMAAAIMLASPTCHADWRFLPSIAITETYSDNYDLQSDELAESQLVTDLVPAFQLVLDNRRVKASASGEWRQSFYRDENTRPRVDNQHRYAADLQGVVVEDLMMIDASAASSQQSISSFGPLADTNRYSPENRTQVKTWRVSPYLVQRFGRQASATLRFTRDSVSSDQNRQFGDSLSSTAVFNMNSGPAYQTMTWGFTYLKQNQDNELTGDSAFENMAANLSYRLTNTFALTASGGYENYDFEGPGSNSGGRNWSAGFRWTPSQRTDISASLGRHFYGNTASLNASVRSRRTVWSIIYGDTITTSRSQFTLPAAIDTAALLNSLFSATIRDPVQRDLVVAAYMQEVGLPPSLANSINFLSNRYMRQKLLQASSAFNWSRSSAVLTLFGSERNALSDQQSDSSLLGANQALLNEQVRQLGASAAWTYRLNSRSSVVAVGSYNHSESLSLDTESRNRELRLGFNRKLGRHTAATVELRRRSGVIGVTAARDYTENAITAAITMKL